MIAAPTPRGLAQRFETGQRRVSNQHERLNELYAELTRHLESGARHTASAWFRRLRDALEAHLEVEERIYFPALQMFVPTVVPRLEALVRDHARFRDELAAIDHLFVAGAWDSGRVRLFELIDSLRGHEDREEEILTEASEAWPVSQAARGVEGQPRGSTPTALPTSGLPSGRGSVD